MGGGKKAAGSPRGKEGRGGDRSQDRDRDRIRDGRSSSDKDRTDRDETGGAEGAEGAAEAAESGQGDAAVADGAAAKPAGRWVHVPG